MGVIYKITNKINGKVYIGLTTVPLSERWKNHCTSVGRVNRPLYNSMKKHGVENFIIEEIDTCDDFNGLGELERYYINLYNSTNPDIGYNMTYGGESNQLDGNPRYTLKEKLGVMSAGKCIKIKYHIVHLKKFMRARHGEI